MGSFFVEAARLPEYFVQVHNRRFRGRRQVSGQPGLTAAAVADDDQLHLLLHSRTQGRGIVALRAVCRQSH